MLIVYYKEENDQTSHVEAQETCIEKNEKVEEQTVVFNRSEVKYRAKYEVRI